MAAGSLAKASTHEKVGPGPLWKTPGLQLPAYIQHVANDLREKRGMDTSRAIATAVAIIKRWAAGTPSGGGKTVHPDTVAAARKALAEWEAAKAKAHATSHSTENLMAPPLALAGLFDPAKHPRAPKGASNGGKFAAGPARNAAGAEAQKDKGAQANADATVGAADADAKLTALSDSDLQALSKYAYSFKSTDPKTVALRIKIANQLAKRGMNVNDFGGLGKGSGAAKKPAASKPAAKPVKAVGGGVAKSAASVASKVTAGVKGIKASHEPLALAAPAVSSSSGPKVTNGAMKTPAHIRAAVKAHGKVPPQLQKGYRRKVIGAAKKAGALKHVPPAWLNGKEA